MKRYRLSLLVAVVLSFVLWAGPTQANPEGGLPEEDKALRPVKHILVLVNSGVGWEAMRQTYTPTFNELAKESVKIDRLVGVYPPVNPEALAALVTGATPGRYSSPESQKTQGESVFQVFSNQGLSTLVVANDAENLTPAFAGFKHKVLVADATDQGLSDQGMAQWKNLKPFATLVVFSGPAQAAKMYGAASQAYLKAITETDRQVSRWVGLLKETGIYDDTLLIVSAEHGIAVNGKDEGTVDKELLLPFIMRGPKIKAGITLPPARMIDLSPTLAYLSGCRMPAQAEGDVLWNALLPRPDLNQETLYEKRVKDLSRQNLELTRGAYRLAEDKLTIDARVADLQEQKSLMQATTEERDRSIASLEQKVRWQRYLIGAIVVIAVIGFLVEYFVLRKRFLMFD
ncbi:MAG: alkaline phosphatase family protein [Heliobacteriaceae bacterium]|nr:alkaline phosphatase family protein [Heliobacteriaceae bacterium]MDD4586831.1 alkaline phosphatase family protein [Heliobacteriaceae bacterium]